MQSNISLFLKPALLLLSLVICACGARQDLYGQQVKRVNDLTLQAEQSYLKGDLKRADRGFSRALELSRAVDYPKGVAQQLNNLGAVALEEGDLARARQLFTEAYQLNEERRDWQEASTNQANLATVAQKAGDWQQAESHLRLAQDEAQRALSKAALGWVRCRWASYHLDRNNLAAAQDFLTQAQPLATTPALKGALYHQWGRLSLAQGDTAAALAYFDLALKADREVLDRGAMAADLFCLGETHQVRGELPRAFFYYNRAFDVYAALGKKARLTECLKRLTEVNSQGHLGYSLDSFARHPLLAGP
jgi:tetratricopeptide (TPR) repeat protein